jgi:hypothetical protein
MWTHKEIAEKVGVAPLTVHNVLKSPEVQNKIALRRARKNELKDELDVVVAVDTVEKARHKLSAEAAKAASVLIDNLLDDDCRIRNKSANDILDRVGISRVSKTDVDTKTSVLILDATQAANLQRSFELDRDDPIDVESKEVS